MLTKTFNINNIPRMILTLSLFLFVIFLIPFTSAVQDYGSDAYGSGSYGQAICGDNLCDASETCGSCSQDCGACTGGGSSSTSSNLKKVNSWTKIIPGVATILKDFDPDIGIKQIQIEVNNEAQNVKVTVTKYSEKPAEVSVEKSGKVYKYLQIETQNLNENLEKAIVTIQVDKNWTIENNVERDNIAMFKFNESLEVWNELETVYIEEDESYYYHDIELDSFSYFAIAERVIVEVEEKKEIKEGADKFIEVIKPYSLWILIGVGVLVVVIVVIVLKIRKKNRSVDFGFENQGKNRHPTGFSLK